MKTKFFIVALLMMAQAAAFAQTKLTARTGHISFYSKMPMETIEANNKQVVAVVDKATGDVLFTMLVKSFSFERALMEEHFNENYMESSKFPKATFKGKITNISEIKFNVNGTYKANIEGDMTIHGVTKKVKESGNFVVNNGEVKATAKFKLSPEDYGIKIPTVVADKISKQFDITVDVDFKK